MTILDHYRLSSLLNVLEENEVRFTAAAISFHESKLNFDIADTSAPHLHLALCRVAAVIRAYAVVTVPSE